MTEKHSRFDVVEVPWDVVDTCLEQQLVALGVPNTALAKVRQSFEEDEDFEDIFVLERDSGEPNSDGTFAGPATIASMPEDLEERLKEFLKRISKVHPVTIPDKRKRKTVSDSVLAQTLLDLESRYPTTLAQDQAALESKRPERQQMAMIVRVGEKKLLQEAKALFENNTSNGMDESSSTPNKRIKISA